MSASAAKEKLPPLDPDLAREADADERRKLVRLRMELIVARSPSVERMARAELRDAEAAIRARIKS